MMKCEYDAARVLLTAYGWPDDMDDDDVIEAATSLAADDYGIGLEDLAILLTKLAPLCVNEVAPLTGEPLIGFGHKGVLLFRANRKQESN